jgi:hypothetical protein
VQVAPLRPAGPDQRPPELLVGEDPPPGELVEHRPRGAHRRDAGRALEEVRVAAAVVLAAVVGADAAAGVVERQ